MKISKRSLITSTAPRFNNTWHKTDIMWMLGLYGTAIGVGVLFLPINAGLCGLLPLMIMAIIAFPMTFFSHRGLCRLILSSKFPGKNITEVVEEHFGISVGKSITLLYFLTIYSILLLYSVAITNTVDSFIVFQLNMPRPPRALLSLILIMSIMTIVYFGEKSIMKTMTILVFPFITVLMLLAIYLIPHWSTDIFKKLALSDYITNRNICNSFLMNLWTLIPVVIFSFNHSPIISAFAIAKYEEYGADAEKKCSTIMAYAHIMMVITVMFFVFSCALSLSPENLAEAKVQNISILSYLANHFNNPVIAYLAPIIAFIAITKSFLGHYLGASEGLNSLIAKFIKIYNINISTNKLHHITGIFILATTWIVATLNPSILGMIEVLGGPIVAILLFLMPMYAIRTVPAMHKYSGKISNIFVVFMGLIAISAIIFRLMD